MPARKDGTPRPRVKAMTDEEYIEWYFGARFIGLPADIAWPSQPRRAGVEFTLRY